jgi:hypothetical protein
MQYIKNSVRGDFDVFRMLVMGFRFDSILSFLLSFNLLYKNVKIRYTEL